MSEIISFEMTKSQVKDFEKLLDKLNNVVKSISKETAKSEAHLETLRLLKQARTELEAIKKFNKNAEKMIWER